MLSRHNTFLIESDEMLIPPKSFVIISDVLHACKAEQKRLSRAHSEDQKSVRQRIPFNSQGGMGEFFHPSTVLCNFHHKGVPVGF